MELIKFLMFVIEVFGLIFVIGLLFNLILDVVIIQPIQNRIMMKKRIEFMNIINEKLKNNEDIQIEDVQTLEKELEKEEK